MTLECDVLVVGTRPAGSICEDSDRLKGYISIEQDFNHSID